MANIRRYKRDARTIVQSKVIRDDTANLRQNSIQIRDANRGFIVYVDDNSAPYGAILDSGAVPGKGKAWSGWWGKARNALAVWLDSKTNERKSALRSAKETVALTENETHARQVTYIRNVRRTTR